MSKFRPPVGHFRWFWLWVIALALAGCGDQAPNHTQGANLEEKAETGSGDLLEDSLSNEEDPFDQDNEGVSAEHPDTFFEEQEAYPPDSSDYTENHMPDSDFDGDTLRSDSEQESMDSSEPEAESEHRPSCRPSDDPVTLLEVVKDLDPKGGPAASSTQSELTSKCRVLGFTFVAAKGMELQAILTPLGGADFAPRLQVYDTFAISGRSKPELIGQDTSAPGFPASVTFQVPWSGEHVLAVSAADLEGTGTFAVEVHCTSGCSLHATRFPIVLLHGIAGWQGGLLNVVEYFFDVQDDLVKQGYDVYAPVSASFNDQYVRAVQFAAQLDEIFDSTGARKLNLVAHSQGGLDGRYIISSMGYGDRIASLVTISTPHKGTAIADAILGLLPGVAQDLIAPVVDFIGRLLGTGDEQDIKAAMSFLTREYVQDEFNPENPDDPRVTYLSFAGHTCGKLDLICQARNNGETVDTVLIAPYRLMQIAEGDNDGLVGVESAEYGSFLGLLPADHWDEIGQLADVVNLSFNHKKFYRDIASMLAKMGF